MSDTVKVTDAQSEALEFVTGFEGRGRQGIPAEVASAELNGRTIQTLKDRGLLSERTRWGRTFIHTTPEARKALGY